LRKLIYEDRDSPQHLRGGAERDYDERQVWALAERFGVSAAVFIRAEAMQLRSAIDVHPTHKRFNDVFCGSRRKARRRASKRSVSVNIFLSR
jgi:hypothetical protein